MKLSRTKDYNFGWLVVFPLIDVVFLLIFFLLLSSNFVFQPGVAVSAPASPFLLGAQQFFGTPQLLPVILWHCWFHQRAGSDPKAS